jgi:hypothetical protein
MNNSNNLTVDGDRLGLIVGLPLGLIEGEVVGISEGPLVGKVLGDCKSQDNKVEETVKILMMDMHVACPGMK